MSTITLHCGDCRDVLPSLADGSVACCLTDPPYGTNFAGGNVLGGYGRRQKWGIDARTITNDTDLSMIADAYPHFQRIVQTGWSAVFFHPRMVPQFMAATSADEYFGMVVWDKKRAGLGYHIRYAHECIAIFRHGEPPRPKEPIMSVMSDWIDTVRHPHEKPVPVLCQLIEWMTKPGDTVFDPFMGVGSTGVACALTGRNFIGCELVPEYYEIACARIEGALRQPALLTL